MASRTSGSSRRELALLTLLALLWGSSYPLITVALGSIPPVPTLESTLAAAVLGLFCTGFALLLYFRLVRTIGSLGVASQSYLRAGLSVLLGVIVLGEQFTVLIAAGLVLIIAGVALISSRR